MKPKYLSTTLIGSWPRCAMTAWNDHAKRLEEGDGDGGADPLQFGSIVHEVAEIYHEAQMRGETPPEPIELFDAVWQRFQLGDLDYYTLGRENIQDFLERTLFERAGDTVGVELSFLYDMEEGDLVLIHDKTQEEIEEIANIMQVPVRSKIDRIDRVAGSPDRIEVYDYKTNRQPFSRDEVDNSLQLFIYDRAVRALYPEVDDVVCIFDMVRHGRFPTSFSEGRAEVLQAYIINIWHQIQNADEPEPSINEYCSYCDWRRDCPAYAAALEGEVPDPNTEAMSPAEIWEHYQHLSNLRKLIRSRRKECKEALNAAIIEGNDGEPLQIDEDTELYLQENPRYEYPPEEIFPLLKDRGMSILFKDPDVVKISRPGLERALKGRDELELVKPMLRTYYVSPTLRGRKPKGEK